MTTVGARPILLSAVETTKSWGSEHWLNAALPDASSTVRSEPGRPTLAGVLADDPSRLGPWARALFGDQLPIFTKLLRADFPPFVHVGFSRAVARETLVCWLSREQAALRQLLGLVEVPTRAAFDELSQIYSAWATRQAVEKWQLIDEHSLADRLARFLRPGAEPRLVATLRQLRQNRAQIVDVLNEVSLRREAGHLLLTPAGLVHSIFGLSHQTHPLDRVRPTLESLLGNLRRLAVAGVSDAELHALVREADLPALRASHLKPPKNEAWLPVMHDGRVMLVEPQQSSDTTYSLADFYTPFVWAGDRMRFRKGDASFGLSSAELALQLNDVDLSVTSLERIRRVPTRVPSVSSHDAILFRLVDDPASWPFFTAYQLDLSGRSGAPARYSGDHPRGVFQQLVVLSGEVELLDAHGHRDRLTPLEPAFIPATLTGGYQLVADGAARVLLFSVPGPYKGVPDQ